MQLKLTSPTDTAAVAAPASGVTTLARLDNPVAVGLIGFACWLGYVIARWRVWAAGHISLFIMSGVKDYSHPSQMHPAISHVTSQGYDGQFYYRFARDPFDWSPTAFGITIDHNYRYTRIGYSLVAWLVSFGGHARLLPTVLVVLNLVFVGVMGYLGARLARESGRHALWGLAFVAYFGLVISVGRDTSEPLADACLLGALLAYRHARYVPAALLMAYGVFTNEPVLVAAAAFGAVRLWEVATRRASPGRPDLVWVVPGALYVALQVAEKIIVPGKSGGAADAAANLTLPFKALVPGVYRDIVRSSWTHLGLYDYNLIEFIALMIIVAAAFGVLRASRATVYEKAAFVGFVVVELVIASGQFWDSTFGDGRTFIDAFLVAVLLLLATPAGTITGAAGRPVADSAAASESGSDVVKATAPRRAVGRDRGSKPGTAPAARADRPLCPGSPLALPGRSCDRGPAAALFAAAGPRSQPGPAARSRRSGQPPVSATDAGTVSAAIAGAAAKAHATVLGRFFAADRVVTDKRLAWLLTFPVVVLILVARRHVLHQ